MNIPGFTAESSLPIGGDHRVYRQVQRKFDNRYQIIPARSFMGDVICNGLLEGCLIDNVSGACRGYGNWCTLGGIFE